MFLLWQETLFLSTQTVSDNKQKIFSSEVYRRYVHVSVVVDVVVVAVLSVLF